MNKKILILLGGLLALIIVIVGFIFFVKSRQNSAAPSAPVVSTTAGTPSGTNPSSGASNNSGSTSSSSNSNSSNSSSSGSQSSAQKASDTAVISPILSYDGQSVWYFTADGHLYTINLGTGLKQEYLLPSQMQVSRIIWPSVGNDFIVETDSTGGKTFTYYNSQQKKFIPYPANVKEVAFLSDGLHVAYQWDNGNGSTSLSMAKPDLSGHSTILALPDADDLLIASPVGSKILAWKANTPNDGKLYYVNLSNTNPKLIVLKTAADNQAKWSPDGEHFVYQKLAAGGDSGSAILYYGDIIAGTDDSLGITASAAKTAFDPSGQNIYVGIPGSNGDTFWKISASNYQKTQISSATGIDSYDLMVSNDSSKLYFVSKKDNYLYLLNTVGK